ncbi:MAG: menaquinone biosynthetic enzyme MqnA/MqnD family protein [bacterium]
MERKIRIGAVSYLNTKPMLVGLDQAPVKDDIELLLEFPSRLVPMLKNGDIDVALLPVAALAELTEYHIVSDYCISTEDEVASVAIYSQVPLDEVKTVILDYQSRTSVMLCKLLFKKHWNKEVTFIAAERDDYFDDISGSTAGLIIGDRALRYIGQLFEHQANACWIGPGSS